MTVPRLVAVLLGISVLVAFAATAAGGSSARPQLAVFDTKPFAVRGLNFRVGERVRVVLRSEGNVYTRNPTASSTGRFVARFASVSFDDCSPYVVSALGAKGSRAGKRYVPMCPPLGVAP